MDYELSNDQKILQKEFRNFFSKECDSDWIREVMATDKGYDEAMWKKMAELGWMGLLIPEEYGGAYETFLDMIVLIYEMGYACFPSPFYSTAVLGVLTLIEAGDNDQKETLLPDVVEGNHFLTLALIEEEGIYQAEGIRMKADYEKGEYILSGTKLFVPDAHIADTIFCVTRTDDSQEDAASGISIFSVDRKTLGLSIYPHKTFTGEKLSEVKFEGVRVPEENLLGEINEGWPLLNRILMKAAVAKCADMSGGAEKVLEMTVKYAKERVQFEHPIGSFQAVQHHCANMIMEADTSRFMTYQAGWRISEGLDFTKEASMCKAFVSDSCHRLVFLAHQVLGGIGFTLEHDLHLFTYRAKSAELAFGDADFHREIVARELGM